MADEMTKVYCYDKPADNSAMWAALMSNRDKSVSPETLMAMNGGGGFLWLKEIHRIIDTVIDFFLNDFILCGRSF